MITFALLRELTDSIRYKPASGFRLGSMGDGYFLQHYQWLADCNDLSGAPEENRGRKWYISTHMTPSEVVQTALAAVLMFEEHEARECFLFRGARVFGPHIHVGALQSIANSLEARE